MAQSQVLDAELVVAAEGEGEEPLTGGWGFDERQPGDA